MVVRLVSLEGPVVLLLLAIRLTATQNKHFIDMAIYILRIGEWTWLGDVWLHRLKKNTLLIWLI